MKSDTMGLTASDLAFLTRAAQQLPEIESVTLFGSRAKGTHRKGSDVDLAVQGDKVTEDTIARLADQLNEQLPLPYFFDVLNYNALTDSELLAHINRLGRVIYRTPMK